MADIVYSHSIQDSAVNAGMDASALQVSGDRVCLIGKETGQRELVSRR